MAKVYEFLANGFEEVEALAPVDILRRGGVEVKTVSITGSPLVESSHGVMVKADLQIEDLGVIDDADMLLIPGGMPGAQNLKDDARVGKALLHQVGSGKRVGGSSFSLELCWTNGSRCFGNPQGQVCYMLSGL